jgi:hypothetical protein
VVSQKIPADLLRQVPWLERATPSGQCIGAVSGAPLRKSYAEYGRPPVEHDPWRCKNPAIWRFTAVPDSAASSGMYCQAHLMARCLLVDGPERERFEDWLAKNSHTEE